MKLLYVILLCIILVTLLASQSQTNKGNGHTEQKQSETILIHPLDKIIFSDGSSRERDKLLVDYVEKNPEDEQWLNTRLAHYYWSNEKYFEAEKYCTQAIYYDYSEVDGLILLNSVIQYKVLPAEQTWSLSIECAKRIKEKIPHCTAISYIFDIINQKSIIEQMKGFFIPIHFTAYGGGRGGMLHEKSDAQRRRGGMTSLATVWPLPKDDKNHPLYLANKYFKQERFEVAIEYYKSFAYEFVLWPAVTEFPLEEVDFDSFDPSFFLGRNTMNAPILFYKIAECYIKIAEKFERQLKDISKKDTERRERIITQIVENYKKAIYYLWNWYDGQLPTHHPASKINQLRQKIKELEDQLKQDKSSESPK